MSLAQLLDLDPHRRARAVTYLRLSAASIWSLRERVLDDEHGGVRAAAAERLARVGRARVEAFARAGGPTPVQLISWIAEALDDRLPSVRERACWALARHAEPKRETALGLRLHTAVAEDPSWRVRRAAARALAAIWGAREQALGALFVALEDPFWRVRHAAVQALAAIVATAPEAERDALREGVLARGADASETGRAALAYLAGGWAQGEAEHPEQLGYIPAPGVGLELGDPDPAVVTARLQASGSVELAGLIRMLPESHAPLREAAARRLAATREVESLWPALVWLEQPRVPHAALEVRRLLARLGERARPLARRVLAEGGRPRAEIWALAFVGTYAAEQLHPAAFERCASERPRLRAAALQMIARVLRRGPSPDAARMAAALERGLDDPDPRVREAAAWGGLSLSAGRLPTLAQERGLSPRLRAATIVQDPSLARVSAGLADPHWRVRAAALTHARPLDAGLRHEPDPLLASTALDAAGACVILLGAEGLEPRVDPSARRRAARELVRLHAREPESLQALQASMREQLQQVLLADADPWLRARGAELCGGARTQLEFVRLVDATRDAAAMVRASASAQLDELEQLGARLLELLDGPELELDTRKAAWSRLILERPASEVLTRIEDALAGSIPAALAEHLEALGACLGRPLSMKDTSGEPAPKGPVARTPRLRVPPPVPRVPLGRSGIELAPLVVSGANGLSEAALAEAAAAGVDTLFWEPRHHASTRFLRQRGRGLQVIAGSFHADRRGIEADLEAARRTLGREQIDLFLLFWVRSPARLSAEALATLRELQASGAIRSYGFSTHDRALACAAIDSGDWPVVMARHSAAHPGAEQELMPLADAAGVGLLGFSALCYGRMLRPSSVLPEGPRAPDCYRYSLSQPAVAACISAPRGQRELRENLEVLAQPRLESLAQERLRAHGSEVHGDNARFNRLVRRGGAGPLREAILELFERCAAEPPESPETRDTRAGEVSE